MTCEANIGQGPRTLVSIQEEAIATQRGTTITPQNRDGIVLPKDLSKALDRGEHTIIIVDMGGHVLTYNNDYNLNPRR